MSVLKNLQALSDLEFYRCAVKLQDDITDFCLRDFGLKRSPRSLRQIIKIPCRKNITRERRKLRKFRNLVFAGRMKPEEVRDQYKSWRGNIIRYNAYKSVRSTDALYKSLFRGIKWTERNGKQSNRQSGR